MLQKIADWFVDLLKAVVLLLPDSPFIFLESESIPEPIQNVLPTLNWLFGISDILYVLNLWLGAVIIYYAYQAVLRWVKAIE